MRNRALVLGVLAALLHGSAYTLYNWQIWTGASRPNAVSWAIWAAVAVINLVSFEKMTDRIKALQFWIGTLYSIATFLNALLVGTFSWPTTLEWSVAAIGGGSAFVLFYFRHAAIANLLIIVTAIIGMIPTASGVWVEPNLEAPVPWMLWSLAFGCTLTNLLTRTPSERTTARIKLGDWAWVPVFSMSIMIVLHLLIVPLCLR